MKSAGNGGVLKGILQVLHVHVLLVAPLGAGYMAQPGTDQHEGRVAVRETARHTGAAADLPVQPLNDIVGADTGPVLTGKIAVSQRLLNAIFYLPGGLKSGRYTAGMWLRGTLPPRPPAYRGFCLPQ